MKTPLPLGLGALGVLLAGPAAAQDWDEAVVLGMMLGYPRWGLGGAWRPAARWPRRPMRRSPLSSPLCELPCFAPRHRAA